jgi:hypothetical protein
MSLEAWTLIAQAVQAGVILVGAFYLNHLVREHRALKDTTIETKNAVIEHLKAVSAPALARDLKELAQYADEMTAKNREMTAKNRGLEGKNRNLADIASRLPDLRYRLGFVQGLEEGRAALRLVFGAVIEDIREAEAQGRPPIPSSRFMDNILDYMKELSELNTKVLDGQKPEPAFGPRADEQDKKLHPQRDEKTIE